MPLADISLPLMPIGSGILWFTNTAPSGWLLCQGQSLLRTDYPALFAVIGTTYGAVDGTHFTLPDLRQRFPLGKAASGTGNTLGATGGAIDHTHTITHTHTIAHTHDVTPAAHQHELPFWRSSTTLVGFISPATFGTGTSRPAILGTAASGNTASVAVYLSESVSSGTVTSTGTSAANSGGSSAANSGSNNPPYQVVNFAIKAF